MRGKRFLLHHEEHKDHEGLTGLIDDLRYLIFELGSAFGRSNRDL